MRKFTLITIFFLAYSYTDAYADFPVDFFVSTEYKKDTIDYSDTIKDYYREKVAVIFSRESRFNLSYICLKQEKQNKYTWNLVLNDVSPNAAFLIGNYFADFASGMLIGRKKIYDPDIFGIKINEEKTYNKSVFIPCNTGNPVFAFSGITAAFNCKIHEIRFILNLFYSIKERFIDEESYESGKISSTMETLDCKLTDEYNHNESLNIHTAGSMLSAEILKIFLLQFYFLNTSINGRYKEKILWEYTSSDDTSNGISKLNGYGCFLQYKDEFLSCLIDGVITQKAIVLNDKKTKTIYGYGTLYGLNFTPPFLSITFLKKRVTKDFYSPYGSSIGEDYPESAWFIDTQIKPYSALKIITQISSQKKSSPSSADNELPVTKKESAALIYSHNRLEEFNFTYRKREKINDREENNQQFLSSLRISIFKILKVNLCAKYQQYKNINASKTFLIELQLLLSKHFILDISYLTAHISNSNPVYYIVSPVRDSSTKGFLIRQDSNIIVFKSDIKFNEIFLSGRYLNQYYNSKSLHSRFEFYASGYF